MTRSCDDHRRRSLPRRGPLSCVALLAIGLLVPGAGCVSGRRAAVLSALEAHDTARALEAYETLRSADGEEPALLARIAANLLEAEAEGSDAQRRREALSALRTAGTVSRQVFLRLRYSTTPVVRATALASLASYGEYGAEAELRPFIDHEDWDVVSEAVTVFSAASDHARLVALLAHPAASVRRAALTKLVLAHATDALRPELTKMARLDPDASVRAVATKGLGDFGEVAFEPLRDRLHDEAVSVRLAAVRQLLKVDELRGRAALFDLLAMPPSLTSVEAAKTLLIADTSQAMAAGEASAALVRATRHAQDHVREQAARLWLSLEPKVATTAIVTLLDGVLTAQAQLALASALLEIDGEAQRKAAEVLATLLEEPGLLAVQAATRLLRVDDEQIGRHALKALKRGLSHDASAVRRSAARALARDAVRPDLARTALNDRDPSVRIQAAGAILAATYNL